MNDITDTLNQIVKCLQPANPYKIVLFGSYAKGNPRWDSDIDIMVILDNENVAKTRQERVQTKLAVCRLLREINRQYAMDIIVYSKAEWHLCNSDGRNSFLTEIDETGRILYERENSRMV
ncbi:MAG: nucleotidyltransferase domain-containing protein [Planctomycetaceae bacterium]|jgi:predicted nucleotidyltransferase|nr:nucleotidyltransferase domain-containing protein [Planctomycetaceae bacterium]